MNKSRTWAVLAVVIAVLILLFLFFVTGGPEQVDDIGSPADGAVGATSTEPAGD